MLSALATSLVVNGDYLVIGALEDKAIVGVYFFGFQLTVAVFSMFTLSLRSVFIPSFIALGDDRRRILRADGLRGAVESLGEDVYRSHSYYERWMAAIMQVLEERGVLGRDAIDERIGAIAERLGIVVPPPPEGGG